MRLSCFSPHSCNELSCSIRLFAGGRTPPPRRSNVPASKRNNVFASQSANLRTCQPSHLSRIYPLYFHRLAHSFALAKNTTPLFSIVSALCVKKPGWGMPRFPRSTAQSRPSRSEPVTSHQSPLWPSVPLQPNALGATIGNSARKLHDPGKQLRSPRCLTILSGHREPFDDLPGYTPTQSGSQVVPGSIVLTLDHSRVARVIHPCRMVR